MVQWQIVSYLRSYLPDAHTEVRVEELMEMIGLHMWSTTASRVTLAEFSPMLSSSVKSSCIISVDTKNSSIIEIDGSSRLRYI